MYTAPGANWTVAYLVAFLPTLAMAGLFTIIGISMPRSGGDYVFTTRALNPYIGFVNYWGINIAYTLCSGIFSYYGTVYLGYLLAGLGAFYGNPGIANLGAYLTTFYPALVVGVSVRFIQFVIMILRPRISWGFILWAGIISLIATAVMIIAIGAISQVTFAAAYNSFMDNSTAYANVIKQGGLTPIPNGLAAVGAALPFTWFAFTWFNLPAAWSGEVKNVKRSMPIAILVAITSSAVLYILFAVVSISAFGQPFLDNWSSLAASGTAPVPGIGGFVPFFALLVYKNIALYFIMFVALWFMNWFGGIPLLMSQTRYIFAMAFDRILPEKLASVSDRLHTPVIASILVCLVTFIGFGAMAILPNSGEFSTAMFAIFSFGFIIPALAGIVFPFRRKQIYEDSFVAKKKFGLPLLSWLGLGTFIYLVYTTYLASQTGSLPIDSFTITVYVTLYGVGVIILAIAYLRNRMKGLPLSLVFKQLPPE